MVKKGKYIFHKETYPIYYIETEEKTVGVSDTLSDAKKLAFKYKRKYPYKGIIITKLIGSIFSK